VSNDFLGRAFHVGSEFNKRTRISPQVGSTGCSWHSKPSFFIHVHLHRLRLFFDCSLECLDRNQDCCMQTIPTPHGELSNSCMDYPDTAGTVAPAFRIQGPRVDPKRALQPVYC